jgi:transposase
VRPRDLAGKTRRRLAAEQLADLVMVDQKIKALTKELKAMVVASGSRLMDLPGVGPIVAARTLADVGHVPGSPTATGSRPGPEPHPSKPPPVRSSGTDSPGPGTGG